MGRKRSDEGPTLAEAWGMLGEPLGLQVESPGEHAIRAHGSVRGHPVTVTIERSDARSEGWRFLAGINTISSRKRTRGVYDASSSAVASRVANDEMPYLPWIAWCRSASARRPI